MKNTIKILLTAVLCLLLSGCGQETPSQSGTTAPDPVLDSVIERNRDAARRRGEFAESELHEYAVSYFTDLLTELFPERDIGNFEVSVMDNVPSDEMLEPLNGDNDRAFELLRTSNFDVEITHTDDEPDLTYDERDAIMQALADKRFTVHLIFAEFYEWDYITDGEIRSEPIPGY